MQHFEARLPIHVVGAIAAAEKYAFWSCNSSRGHRHPMASGQTVEILNTDAEVASFFVIR